MEFVLEKDKESVDIDTIEGKISYARIAAMRLSKIVDSFERELYIKKLSVELDINEDIIRSECKKQALTTKKSEERKQEVKEKYKLKAQSDFEKIENNLKVCEGELVNIIINSPQYYKRLEKYIKEDYFSFELYNKIVKIIKELISEKGGYDINMIMDRLPQNEKGSVAMLKLKDLKYEINDKNVSELLKRIELLKKKKNVNEAGTLEDLSKQLERLKKKENN